MTRHLDGTYRYVRHQDADAYLQLGWINTGTLAGTHHGHYGDAFGWHKRTQFA